MIFILLLSLLFGQGLSLPMGSTGKSPGSGNTYTFLHSTTAVCASPCAVTVPSTGTGNLIVVQNGVFNHANYLTAVTGGCSFALPVSSQVTSFSSGSVSTAYCLSSTSGVTSISITTTSGSSRVRILEYSALNPPAFDSCSTVNDTTTGTLQPGVALSLSTSNETILQMAIGSANITGISSPYGNFFSFGGIQLASADSENTSSGAAPNWTMVSGTMVGNACAWQ